MSDKETVVVYIVARIMLLFGGLILALPFYLMFRPDFNCLEFLICLLCLTPAFLPLSVFIDNNEQK